MRLNLGLSVFQRNMGKPLLNSSPLVNSGGNPYTTFTAVGTYGFDADSNGTGLQICGTEDEISVLNGFSYSVKFNLTTNSGLTFEGFRFATGFGGTSRSNTIIAVNILEGYNSHVLIATADDTVVLQFYHNNDVGNVSLRNLSVTEI